MKLDIILNLHRQLNKLFFSIIEENKFHNKKGIIHIYIFFHEN